MWFWWALASALISGISVTFNKRVLNRGVHSSVVSLSLFIAITLISIPLLIKNGIGTVDTTFFIAAFVSALVFSIAKTIALKIYKENNLSDIYPLASIAPITLYLLSILFLEERVKISGIIGILLMALGVYILNFTKGNKDLLHPLKHFYRNRYSILFLGGIILSNISSVAEKIAIKHTFPNGVYQLAFWENFFLSLIIGGYVIKTNKGWLTEIKDNFGNLLIAGTLFSLLYYLVIFGFKEGAISLVSAIKKLEVLIVLIISYVFFNERPTKRVYIATIIMLVAVLLIKL